jgi:hypothetical protein
MIINCVAYFRCESRNNKKIKSQLKKIEEKSNNYIIEFENNEYKNVSVKFNNSQTKDKEYGYLIRNKCVVKLNVNFKSNNLNNNIKRFVQCLINALLNDVNYLNCIEVTMGSNNNLRIKTKKGNKRKISILG